MDAIQKQAIENYQCPGCVIGSNIKCFKQNNMGIGCGAHVAGTMMMPAGLIYLGMPKGFCRLGPNDKTKIVIYKSFQDYGGYDMWNIPTWKHLDEHGHTLVRWMSPRINHTCIHVFLEDCRDKINCYEVTQDDIDAMD